MNRGFCRIRGLSVGLTAAGLLTAASLRAATFNVDISNFSFQPAQVSVNVGDTVTWTQRDATRHTSTSDSGLWSSPLLSVGQTFSFTFRTAGTFTYHCSPHPFMTGSVVVMAAANNPPVVSIIAPTNNAIFAAPFTGTIHATASDTDGTVSKVEFMLGANLAGTVTSAPYDLGITNLAAGKYTLTAKATDNLGASTTSAPVNFTVDNPPTVLVTAPSDGSVLFAPATITIQADAADADGTVKKVELYVGTNVVATLTGHPYAFTWKNVPAGTYTISAEAADDSGLETNSDPVTVTVLPPSADTRSIYVRHNLVSDLPGQADHIDPNLLNPWGIAMSATGPFWISDNHSGFSTLYNSRGELQPLVVTIPPPPGGMPPAAPTGIVFNDTKDFVTGDGPAHFIFATEDGTIIAWRSGSSAVLKADKSATGAVYKGIALASVGAANYLYAANFHAGTVDIFDASFAPVTMPGAFVDPTVPAGFAPFNVQNFGGKLFVTYAMQDADKHDDVSGAGNGFVDVYDTNGKWIRRLISNGPLNSPWGMAMAPADFGKFGNALLVGNFGDGTVNAFDSATGSFLGTLQDASGKPLKILGLWALHFGNGESGGDADSLYFTAGIPGGGELEDHGLFGRISPLGSLRITRTTADAKTITINWSGGAGPYLLQSKGSLAETNWMDLLTTTDQTAVVAKADTIGFFRVSGPVSATVIPFSASLNGVAERPNSVATGGLGLGVLSLEGNTLNYRITYAGLSGAPIAAHIHGPATVSQAAAVEQPLGPLGTTTSGTLVGSLTLTDAQVADLKNGMVYVNIHTAANPGGEIRGQITP